MAAPSSSSSCIRSRPVSFPSSKTPTTSNSLSLKTVLSYDHHKRSPFRVSAAISNSKARFVARRKESVTVRQLQRPLMDYMRLPGSQYSVLDAERIERVDDNTFRCYVYRLKYFAFEVYPVLLVRVEEQPNGCCINLLSCNLESSPVIVAQNDKFDASMVNRISCDSSNSNSAIQQLTSDAIIESTSVETIESTGTQFLEQTLKLMLPRFMAQAIPRGSPLELVRFEIAKNRFSYSQL